MPWTRVIKTNGAHIEVLSVASNTIRFIVSIQNRLSFEILDCDHAALRIRDAHGLSSVGELVAHGTVVNGRRYVDEEAGYLSQTACAIESHGHNCKSRDPWARLERLAMMHDSPGR